MEPSFNPALEAQAIGRIHRLGQKRNVEIVRLVVKNSFEERMVDFIEKKYGLSSEKKPEAASDDEEKKDATDKKIVDVDDSRVGNGIAGNLNTDRAQLVTAEFDALFGVEGLLPTDECASGEGNAIDGEAGTKADEIASSGFV